MTASSLPWDSLWLDARLATCDAATGAGLGIIEGGALGVKDGRLIYVGPEADLPGAPDDIAREVHHCAGHWVTPGLVDCHTHIVYGGNRAAEFEKRLEGATYEEISRAGGGIRSTVAATRAASESDLMAQAEKRLRPLLAEGVTTIEIKSGYGLDVDTELRQLRVARALGQRHHVDVSTSYLGAHAVPPEFAGNQDGYVDFIVDQALPRVAAEGLADVVDGFCDKIGFTAEQTEKIFAKAKALGLPVKLHAEQLSNLEGAALAARYDALSADHLEYLSAAGIAAMAKSGTVAVLLPGAFYYLRETKLPPIDELRQAGVPIAISTDCNPGSSPIVSLLLIANMACTLFRMTPTEALLAVTRNGAKALGLGASHGTLARGKIADFVLWDIEAPADLAYLVGANPARAVVKAGRIRSGAVG